MDDTRERLIFDEFFKRSVRIAPYGANGGERVKDQFKYGYSIYGPLAVYCSAGVVSIFVPGMSLVVKG